MNIGSVTARIIKKPVKFANFGYYFTQLDVVFLHTKNYFARAVALADGQIGATILDLYRKGDYLIIEGEYVAFDNMNQSTSLVIYITEVNPAYLIMPK